MLAERRTRALRDVEASLAAAADEAEVARRTVSVLEQFEFDLPFLLYYVFDPNKAHYTLAAHHGIAPGKSATPSNIARTGAIPWPFAKAVDASSIIEVDDLSSVLEGESCGPYEE